MIAIYLVLFLLSAPQLQAKNYDASFTDFHKCKVHYSRSEKLYKNFYEIPDGYRAGEYLLDFHFSVLARSDAHILLTPTTTLTRDTAVYEIVLGAGGNSFSDIRRMQKSDVRATSRLKGVLSAIDVKSFWIHITEAGLVEVGQEGEELAFLSWRDSLPLDLKYFSFCTWTGVEAKWFYDCPLDNNVTINSKEVEPVLTDLERLRKDLLSQYNPYVRPVYDHDTATTINFQFTSIAVSLDERSGILDIHGEAKMNWTDEKLTWDPENYGDISSLHMFSTEVWLPEFIITNAVDNNLNIFETNFLLLGSKGEVLWKPRYQIGAWCDASKLGHWPSDEHTCSLNIMFRKEHHVLELIYENDTSHIKGTLASSWNILKLQVKEYTGDAIGVLGVPLLTLDVKLKRYSEMYTLTFFTPFVVIAFCQLVTFMVSPNSYLRICLGCFQLILTTIMLMSITFMIPAHPITVPFLVNLYSYSYVAIAISLWISICVINLSRNDHSRPVSYFLRLILTSWFLKKLLFLPDIKSGNQYGKIQEVSATQCINDTWILLGVVIDRIAFVVYLILIWVALSMQF